MSKENNVKKAPNPQLQTPDFPYEQYGLFIRQSELEELDNTIMPQINYPTGKLIEKFLLQCRANRRAEYLQDLQEKNKALAEEQERLAKQKEEEDKLNPLKSIPKTEPIVDADGDGQPDPPPHAPIASATPVTEPTVQ